VPRLPIEPGLHSSLAPSPPALLTPSHPPHPLKPPPRPPSISPHQAKERGLTRPGDRVVVSQCPRVTQRHGDLMSETGVVKILTLGADGVNTRVATAVLDESGTRVVGSREE
jgi:hypothetical protein